MSKSPDESRRARAFSIHRSEDAREKISFRKNSSEVGEVRIWGRRSDGCAALEQDFTTSGTPGRLGCPFASTLRPRSSPSNKGVSTPRSSVSRGSLGRRSKRASFHDPIKADICGNNAMPSEASVAGSVPLCPIRFLDQHSPEEVATYFEKHKHEVPRSHETCIKRFQENEEVLKSLDSKYANIVTMMKDLGKVHQPMLPDTDDIAVEDGEGPVHDSAAKVENWAKAVDSNSDGAAEEETPLESDRESRFDRPLKDIRVGESPSRPWGIVVPENFKPNGDAASKKSDPTASPLEADAPRCPFSGLMGNSHVEHPALGKERDVGGQEPQSTTKAQSFVEGGKDPPNFSQPKPAQMVFNGPVFIGYPLDQAMGLMKQFGPG
jgi:hypothetical protein